MCYLPNHPKTDIHAKLLDTLYVLYGPGNLRGVFIVMCNHFLDANASHGPKIVIRDYFRKLGT